MPQPISLTWKFVSSLNCFYSSTLQLRMTEAGATLYAPWLFTPILGEASLSSQGRKEAPPLLPGAFLREGIVPPWHLNKWAQVWWATLPLSGFLSCTPEGHARCWQTCVSRHISFHCLSSPETRWRIHLGEKHTQAPVSHAVDVSGTTVWVQTVMSLLMVLMPLSARPRAGLAQNAFLRLGLRGIICEIG